MEMEKVLQPEGVKMDWWPSARLLVTLCLCLVSSVVSQRERDSDEKLSVNGICETESMFHVWTLIYVL